MSDSEAPADNDVQTEHQAGGEFADPNATVTCTTCFAEVRNDNVAKHFNWHIDVGDHTDEAQRDRPDAENDDDKDEDEDD